MYTYIYIYINCIWRGQHCRWSTGLRHLRLWHHFVRPSKEKFIEHLRILVLNTLRNGTYVNHHGISLKSWLKSWLESFLGFPIKKASIHCRWFSPWFSPWIFPIISPPRFSRSHQLVPPSSAVWRPSLPGSPGSPGMVGGPSHWSAHWWNHNPSDRGCPQDWDIPSKKMGELWSYGYSPFTKFQDWDIPSS